MLWSKCTSRRAIHSQLYTVAFPRDDKKIMTMLMLRHYQQGNQRWQIPRPAPCQCLATFTPLKSKKNKNSWRHFTARSSFYFINWYGYPRGSHEKTFERNCQSSFWDTPLNCYMLSVAHVTNDVKWRPIVTTFGTRMDNMSRRGCMTAIFFRFFWRFYEQY